LTLLKLYGSVSDPSRDSLLQGLTISADILCH